MGLCPTYTYCLRVEYWSSIQTQDGVKAVWWRVFQMVVSLFIRYAEDEETGWQLSPYIFLLLQSSNLLMREDRDEQNL